MTLGTRIKALRNEAKLSQRAFASALGTTQQIVFNWEHDKFSPSLDHLMKICNLFNCTPNDLLL